MSLEKWRVMLGCKAWKWRANCKRDVGRKDDGKNITLELHGEPEQNLMEELKDELISLMKRIMENIIKWFEELFK
jgi:hypothetical protein